MRHNLSHRKFSRSPAHRRALLRNMATSLFEVGRFETTLEKAKDLRGVAEKLITVGKKGSLAARRQVLSYLQSKLAVRKLFDEIAPSFKSRNGGYTRVVRTRTRSGDAAQMAIIELVDLAPKAADSVSQ